MGAFTAKVLAEGQLANSKGTLYTVPASTKVYVKWFSLYSSSATTQTVQLYLKPGATSRTFAYGTMTQNTTWRVLDAGETIELEAGDLIEGNTTTASVVDYVITGVEEA